MRGLRFAYLAALAAWLGGLVVLGTVAAPVLFDVLPSRVPGAGRALAGAAFGAILSRFHLVALACGAVMALSLVAMALVGPRPRPYAWRLVVLAMMLAATVVALAPVGGRMERLQRELDGVVAAAPDDARRAEFSGLHRLSGALLLANVAGGLLLLAWEVRPR